MTDLALSTDNLPDEYRGVLADIDNHLPAATRHAEVFNKSASQFKAATLDVADLTPISSARHLLAVIQRTRQALEEASIALRRKRLEAERKQQALMSATGRDADELLIDLDELGIQIANVEASARGALRKLSHALAQYRAILDRLGVEHLTEADYEADQARYHVMTAFNQALTAARARGGLIDEGNHIYLMQLGINGAVAQAEVTALLEAEEELIAQGKAPTHEAVIRWLEALADRFADAPANYAARRGLPIIHPDSLIALESTP